MTRRIGCTVLALALAAVGCETPTGTTTSELGDTPGLSSSMHISTPCTFTTSGSTMTLDGDCQTDATITVPDGFTLDGDRHTITAVDPEGDHFRGPVVTNEGSEMYVTELTVTASDLANACDGGADRLRGIMFEAASGSVDGTTVSGINQGASGCQEGAGIDVRAAPFDGSGSNPFFVEISNSEVTDYQKTGILAVGDVEVSIHNNKIGASATQENLAANSLQISDGALGTAVRNQIDGNQWKGTTNFSATAVLTFDAAAGTEVSRNNIRGNSEVGIFIISSDGTYTNNKVFDEGPDHPNATPDFGIFDFDAFFAEEDVNVIVNNKIRGFDFAIFPEGENNKVVGQPNGSPQSP